MPWDHGSQEHLPRPPLIPETEFFKRILKNTSRDSRVFSLKRRNLFKKSVMLVRVVWVPHGLRKFKNDQIGACAYDTSRGQTVQLSPGFLRRPWVEVQVPATSGLYSDRPNRPDFLIRFCRGLRGSKKKSEKPMTRWCEQCPHLNCDQDIGGQSHWCFNQGIQSSITKPQRQPCLH